jgi:hypothetical protein
MTSFLQEHDIENFLRTKDDGSLHHRESQTLEFKESFSFGGMADYLRDFVAFANNRGGYLIFGVKDKPRECVGLSENARNKFDKIDPETITGYLIDYFSGNIIWEHEVYTINNKSYGAFYVLPAEIKPIICKKDKDVLKNGEVYYRYGGRTQKIQHSELEAIISNRIEAANNRWQNLVQKIAKAGPQNAEVIDTEKGIIESQSKTILIDENLIQGINWIKEGSFHEKEGGKTLKLVGEVKAVDKVEAVKKIEQDRLRLYPLSALKVLEEVQKRNPNIKRSGVWKIIKENDIKSNRDYSIYNFRNKSLEDEFKKTGILPKGTPSIYKESVVDFILTIYNNEAKNDADTK